MSAVTRALATRRAFFFFSALLLLSPFGDLDFCAILLLPVLLEGVDIYSVVGFY